VPPRAVVYGLIEAMIQDEPEAFVGPPELRQLVLKGERILMLDRKVSMTESTAQRLDPSRALVIDENVTEVHR
jgi:hypothetical protein